jgi:hypothetical protein
MKPILTLLLSLSVVAGIAQTLERRAWMGIQTESFNQNSLVGLKVLSIHGGTAAELKLKEGDILLEMDGNQLTDVKSLQARTKDKFQGDPITVTVYREKKKKVLKGKFMGRSLETHQKTDVIYDQAPFRNGQLRVIINKPRMEGKMPAMLFIPGYTCSSIDNLADNHPYKRIVNAYANDGYVTLRIEKSGLGDSRNTLDCESCDLYDEIENFEAGLLKLKSLPYVDTAKIIIVGHSMGGTVAPALSSKHTVAGVIVYGTAAKSWFEYIIEMTRIQNQLAGMEPLEHEKSVQDQYEAAYRFYIQKEPLSELAKNPVLDSILRASWEYNGYGKIYGRNAEYWRQIQHFQALKHWKNTKAKVLVQFGESDFQAFSLADHQQIVHTVNYYHPGNATLKTFPLTDHYFAKSGTMQEAFNKFVNRQIQQLFDEYNHDVGTSAVEWSNMVIEK